ncbi:MAG: hypothetical protein V4616_14925 [Bacteroidota bacterium]
MKNLLPVLTIFLLSCGSEPSVNVELSDGVDTVPAVKKEYRSADWHIKDLRGSKILFTGGDSLETNLYELRFIDTLPASEKAPYFIVSGRNCKDCNENISLYVHSPSDGPITGGSAAIRYAYPGSVRDYVTQELTSSTRVFYGEVVPGKNGIIWYQKEKTVNDQFMDEVYFLHDVNGKLQEESLSDTNLLRQTLSLNVQGRCTEIKGREFTNEK